MVISLDAAFDAIDEALARLQVNVRAEAPEGLSLIAEQVASRARESHTYTDRSSALTQSTQATDVQRVGDGEFTVTVSFAAKSRSSKKYPSGYNYGLVQHWGNKAGTIKGNPWILKALQAQDNGPLVDCLRRAIQQTPGFRVVG